MRISIHLQSAAAGALAAILVILSLGAFQHAQVEEQLETTPSSASAILGGSGPLQVDGIPTPQQMMRVLEGAPFTVPVGQLFVGQSVWGSGGSANGIVLVLVDGQPSLTTSVNAFGGNQAPIVPGLVVGPGATVEPVCDPGGNCSGSPMVLLGYLADA